MIDVIFVLAITEIVEGRGSSDENCSGHVAAIASRLRADDYYQANDLFAAESRYFMGTLSFSVEDCKPTKFNNTHGYSWKA